MASSDERLSPEGEHTLAASTSPELASATDRPSTPVTAGDANGFIGTPKAEATAPLTPSRIVKRAPLNATPRLKKKVPWKGKNILVSLPRDENRGQLGKGAIPLNEAAVKGMLRSWEELGYSISGFDLDRPAGEFAPGEQSQSRGAWPDFEDLVRERRERNWKILLPDLNAWKKYVDELNEAKLRALGVSFGEDEPPAPSISPASTMSRQASVTHYPPLPFSPPLPTSSASSAQAIPGFPFPPPFTAVGSPGIPGSASPASFTGKFNPRASISIPSPHGHWSPQLMMGHGHRAGSPSLANLAAMMSPVSPFSPDGISGLGGHQRHQSLQFPLGLSQQFQPARASPRLQDLREVEEEPPSKSPSKTPEPNFVRHNPSDSLQREIDEAEYQLEEQYHLEEQMRSQFENDDDYNPHNSNTTDAAMASSAPMHAREPSVQFAPQPPRFGTDGNDLVLHHPRPHSRGHSLSQKYFTEDDVGQGGFKPALQGINTHPGDESEIETNPSNLGTPIQAFDFSKGLHQRSFSTASNPWTDNESGKSASGSHHRLNSHGSKPSLSKLNVEAPEFKFNPTSTFKPGQFSFGSTLAQPTVFNAGMGSATSSQFSFPPTATSSKINPTASVFSPRQSEFSFSSSGPKFRPDAPSFTPHSLSNSITSNIMSGAESGSNKGTASLIFSNIDLNPDVVKPAKQSKAIPIVRPESNHSSHDDEPRDGADGRLAADESRVKRVRARHDDGDDVPLFAEQPVEEATPVPEAIPKTVVEDESVHEDDSVPVEEKSFEESTFGQGDMDMSSTLNSEVADTKATSPTGGSDQGAIPWGPFEFNSANDLQSFNNARPFGEDTFKRGHKKSLSATATPFVPGTSLWQPTAEAEDDAPADQVGDDDFDQFVDRVEHVEESVVKDTKEVSVEVEEKPASELIEKSVETAMLNEPSPAPVVPTVSIPPAPKPKGLKASRFAAASPVKEVEARVAPIVSPLESPLEADAGASFPAENLSPLSDVEHEHVESVALAPGPSNAFENGEPSMADIDAIMLHLNKNPDMGVIKTVNSHVFQPSPTRQLDLAAVTNSSPFHLPPQSHFRSDAPSPSPRRYADLPIEPSQPILSTELEDPFIDPPQSAQTFEGAVHRLNGSESLPASDWDGAFSEDEQGKLEARVNFFDGHVNQLVGGLLAARLGPLEQTLESIKHGLAGLSRGTPSSRRERRSASAEIKESDADDEDDEMPVPRRSMSPRRDRRMEQIRAAVLDALATQQRNVLTDPMPAHPAEDTSVVLKALEEMKEQFSQTLHLDFRGEDLKNIVEEAVESRIPPTPVADDKSESINAMEARIAELEQKLRQEQTTVEAEVAARRVAEDRAADLNRELESAATKIEVEMMNKSALNQRINDLEERTHHFETQVEAEVQGRRAAEDRLSEVQRLLRISSEEETRLREVVDDKEHKVKTLESTHAKATMRLTLLEASQSNSQQSQSETQNRINVLEVDLRDARQEARHWRSETDRFSEMAKRHDDDLSEALKENKAIHKLLDTLNTQLQENDRIRENWRSKFVALQNEMERATREISEENARRTKREQELLARQEVLDARLQAEARTRERIETELERLEMNERQGMRAVSECKRLEGLLAELRTENNKLHQTAMRFQAEFQEARESGAREVQRTRDAMQGDLDAANHQVNVVREELEDQVARLRSQLDQVKMDADTSKARLEMLLEEAQTSQKAEFEHMISAKQAELEELARRHQNEIEDMQARYERQINNTTEDAQRAEQNLLERLSISTSKTEHLQDKVAHLQEKLEIAKQAAKAAAEAAKSTVSVASSEPTARARAASRISELPEKISPQALRESIMVLQEQLQEREHRIEELEQLAAQADPEAEVKISKRDDEIIWLRELLAVRHSDLQDIILALSRDDYDRYAVKDAAIRLKANLQMEEQERERAMNGGSAINLPNIAATISAATPRVAQAVGPLAAAWGNWRKGRDPAAFGSLGSVLSSPAHGASGRDSTPSKNSSASNSFLGGLLTPPASGVRQTPPAASAKQPTAFASTGRRFTPQDLANRPRGQSSASISSRKEGKMPVRERDTPPRRAMASPRTPPMMRPSAYDSDAQAAEDFDDAGFFDD
ncbi:hypothetical protein B0T14DRAFT_575870 [Immersiella caudata]|uniref:Myosin class II heavy chain n=1 Tax=Immersiella caudata TaxID=314043 RepID=A0AA39XGM8_9PEZI|nr:hypothetical protein B0T14DRAFT_575870 [Immersiella caudata]